jgi:ABC-type lipoprotein release transport system permease subunit
MRSQPPKLARRLLEWWSGSARIDDLLGDLDEWYALHTRLHSPLRAQATYWRQVLSLCFSYGLRKRKRDAATSAYATSGFSFDMLRNYVKVAVRTLYQYRYFSMLNVFGLAIGMSVSLLLIALVSYVKTYDDFHEHRALIYTLTSERTEGVEQLDFATAPVLLAEALRQHSDVREVVRIQANFSEEVRQERGSLPLRGYYVDPSFLDVFTYEVIQGDGPVTLSTPNSVVLTESAARRIFNSTEVLGRTLELEHGGVLEVGAVMKDHPINSHFKFELLVSYATLPVSTASLADQWMNYGREYVYVLLREGAEAGHLEEEVNRIAESAYKNLPVSANFHVQPLKDIAMGPDYRQAIGPKWEMSGMIVFMVIAALILLPACFNYTNISMARSLKRAKEIGLRKTMGGQQHQIFFQFITETVVITVAALAVGILLFLLARSEFKSMLVASSSLDLSLTPTMIFWFFLLALGTGFMAGFFPAMYFGGLNPIQALKSKVHSHASAMRVRKVLTIFQFALSFGFILALIVFSRQYRYSVGFDFGFDKSNIVNVPLQDVDPGRVRDALSPLASVQRIAFASDVLGLSASSTWVKGSVTDSLEVFQLFVDENYLKTFGLTLLAGTPFDDRPWHGEKAIIVNEEFLTAYSIIRPADALGRTFEVEGKPLEVIGVVKNFHYAPLRFPVGKFFFRQNPERYTHAHLRVESADAFTLFTQLEDRWKGLTDRKFEGRYFEQEIQDGYSMYRTLIKIIGFLGLLAISISLLGMLGMVVYTAETRMKEVGIRKVMGASVPGITFLLSKDYLRLMLLAVLIGAPVTAALISYLMPYIQYYSVSLNFWDVLVATILLVGLGLATIASQAYRTARTNPVETLRAE